MSLRQNLTSLLQDMSGLSLSWPLQRIVPEYLDRIESEARNNDQTAMELEQEIEGCFKKVSDGQPQDYNTAGSLYQAYGEAVAYILLKERGLSITRTAGTGKQNQKRPDFTCSCSKGDFFVEVKTLDFDDRDAQHTAVMESALNNQANLEDAAKTPGTHFGEAVEISSHKWGATRTDRIEALIRKLRNNLKREQLSFGPTLLVVHLGLLEMDANRKSTLSPVFFDQEPTVRSCISGELWNAAFGEVGNQIYDRPDFEGKSNLDRALNEDGVLIEHPYLLGIAFITQSLGGAHKIFTLHRLSPDFNDLKNSTNLGEFEIAEILHDISDARNDDKNESGYEYQSCY